MTRRLMVLLVALAALVMVPVATAVSMTDVAEELRCITCGTSLDVSDAPSAQQMKERIQRRIDEGATKQQIIDEFVADYGRQVLATPPKKGFDLVAGWMIPLGVLALGLVFVPVLIRAWTRRRRASPASSAALDDDLSDDDAERLDRELRDFGR